MPLLAGLILLYIHKRWTKFALIGGIIISILEFVDYGLGLPESLRSGAGSNAAMMLFWIALRVCVLFIFYNAFKAKTKSITIKK